MSSPATTKMSSKGQVVIPEEIRNRLGLTAGMHFVVVGDKGVVILKSLAPPKMSEFDDLVGRARQEARAVGLNRSDVARAVKTVKGRK